MMETGVHQTTTNMQTLSSGRALSPSAEPQNEENSSLRNAPRVPPMVASRNCTPIRPVYDDFATAHSSITSGSASGLSRDKSIKNSKKQAGVLNRNRPLSRRIHRSVRRRKKSAESNIFNLPSPAKLSNRRTSSDLDVEKSQTYATSHESHDSMLPMGLPLNPVLPKRASGSLLMDSLKKAMEGKLPLVSRVTHNRLSLSLKWPRDSMELPCLARKDTQPTGSELEDGQGIGNSLESSNKDSLPDLPFYIHDPFVYDTDRKPVLVTGEVSAPTNVVDDSQQSQKFAGFQQTYRFGAGLPALHSELSTHEIQYPSNISHGDPAFAINSEGRFSTRDGSTVDNIVNQYAQNNGLWDVSLDSKDEDSEEIGGYLHLFGTLHEQIQGLSAQSNSGNEDEKWKDSGIKGYSNAKIPTRPLKLMDSAGKVPSTDLPRIPRAAGLEATKSISEGLGQSSSYGDTRKLLDITQRSQFSSNTGLPNDEIIGGLAASNNPFRRVQHQKLTIPSSLSANPSLNLRFSQMRASAVGEILQNPTHGPLPALERDISRALRRMSTFSNLSRETSAYLPNDGGFQSTTDSSSLLSFIGRQNQSAPEPLKPIKQGFYHESALHQTWLNSQRIERVRIPIRHNVSVSSSLPVSDSASSAADEFGLEEMDGQTQNGTEWETVVDGVMDRVKKAGSSLANNSSIGNISPIFFEHNDFSSTDRIIQHPAQIEYSHDYRYKEIRDGGFPVLLPSYKPHTVNGFPANSCRSIGPFQQSAGDVYQSLPPLPRSHTNPFRSLPPEIITNKSSSSGTLEHNRFEAGSSSRVKVGTPSLIVSGDHLGHWMDAFGDPGPVIQPFKEIHNFGLKSHSEDTLSDSYSSSQIVGSSIADASSLELSGNINDVGKARDVAKAQAFKFNLEVERTYEVPSVSHERTMFIKGPPGAFYQGVRSRPDPSRKGSSSDRNRVTRPSQRKAAQFFPTNQVRPLSLLQNPRIDIASGINEDGDVSGGRPNDSFACRSPLAPIKSKSWCDLYTREQLSSMHIEANIKSVTESELMSSQSSRQGFGEALKIDESWKRTWSPHLRPWPRDNSSIKSDLSSRKQKISIIGLCLCCLFPPMLVLYGIGYLDNIMLWVTHGEISSFGKAHKRVALQMVCFFVIAILVVVPITVAVKVTGSK